jgi:hypothetical protein
MQGAPRIRSTAFAPSVVWAAAGFGIYAIVGVGSLFLTGLVIDPVLKAMGLPAEAGEIGLSVRNAIQPIVWGILAALVAIPVGRAMMPGLQFRPVGWLLLLAGLLLASATWFLIEEFVRARFTYMDPEYVGFSLLTWPALVAIALSGWAALAVPRPEGSVLIGVVVLGVIALAAALAPSIPGALDGISPENLPLAAVFGVDAAYGLGVTVAVLAAPQRTSASA